MRLPKYVYKRNDKYQVLIPKLETKGKTNHYIGIYESMSAALHARDTAIKLLGEERKTDKNPARGVTIRMTKKYGIKYDARIEFLYKNDHIHLCLGTFETLEDAVKARINFLDNLK